jgi:hypothetical protein
MNPEHPNFFIVGAAKAGTTSLYRYLEQHPDVFMCSLKEPNWFSRVHAPGRVSFVSSEEEYLSLFEGRDGESAAGEASPSYLWDEEAPRRIKDAVPHAKIVAILRHPVERAFSDYLQTIQWEREELPFLEALKQGYETEPKIYGVSRLYVDLGLYAEQVQRYLETFGEEQIKILLHEDFKEDPRAMLESVLEFLDVDPGHASSIRTDVQYNKYSIPKEGTFNRLAERVLESRAFRSRRFTALRAKLIPDPKLRFKLRQHLRFEEGEKPELDEKSRQFMMELYRPDILKLQNLLDRDLGHWLEGRP